MPAQSLAMQPVERFEPIRPVLVRDASFAAVISARTVYQSQRVNPASAIAALTLAAAAFSSFQYLGAITPHHKLEPRLTIVNLADLMEPPPPPPPAAAKLPERQATDVPLVQPEIVAPPPIVVTPAPAPSLAVTDTTPAPAPAPVATRSAATATVEAGPSVPSVATTEAGDLSSKMLSATPPSYPLESRRLREQGTVTLAVLLSIDGRVERLSIAKSSGFARLDRAASGAVRHWRWSPMVRNGQPVLVQGNVVIPFVLRG